MDNNDIIQHKSKRNLDISTLELIITEFPLLLMFLLFLINFIITVRALYTIEDHRINKDNNNFKDNYIFYLYLGIINIIISIIHIICIYFYLDRKESLIALVLLIISNIFNIVTLIYTQNNQILLDVPKNKRSPIVIGSSFINLIFGIANHIFIFYIIKKNSINKK